MHWGLGEQLLYLVDTTKASLSEQIIVGEVICGFHNGVEIEQG